MSKIFIIVRLLVLILLFQSCHVDTSCGECFVPPWIWRFTIVDSVSRENVFTNGTFDPKEISVTDNLKNNEPVAFGFISENNVNILELSPGFEKRVIKDLKVELADRHIFTFYFDAERVRYKGGCCDSNKINERSVSDAFFKYDEQKNMYTILID